MILLSKEYYHPEIRTVSFGSKKGFLIEWNGKKMRCSNTVFYSFT